MRLFWAFVLAASTLFSADWIRLKSENFEILSSASESKSNAVLHQFEQVAGFFQQLNKTQSNNSIPVRIILFGSQTEYIPYRMNESASAFFHPAPDADYIVLVSGSNNIQNIGLHEYVHLLIRRSHSKLPLWLEEGFADLFSTLRAADSQTEIGAVPSGRAQRLFLEELLPLNTLITADRHSALYNENNRIGMFYSQSWALTHMLRLSDGFRQGFEAFFNLILAGYPTDEALQRAYGRSVDQVEGDLRAYIAKGRLRLVRVPIRLKKERTILAKLDDAGFIAQLSLSNLQIQKDPFNASRSFEQLMADHPTRPEPVASLGYLQAAAGDPVKALALMERAINMGYRHPRLFKDYSLLQLAAGKNALFITFARKQLELEPDDAEQRQRVAAILFQMTDYAQALAELQKIEKPPLDLASRQYQGIAHCAIQLGDWPLVQKSLELLRKVSRTAEEAAEVKKIEQAIALFNP